VSQYQKGTTNLDFTEAKDSEWQWHQLSHMQICTLPQAEPWHHPPLINNNLTTNILNDKASDKVMQQKLINIFIT